MAQLVLVQIITGDTALLAAGDAWLKRQGDLNAQSFVYDTEGIILRESPQFVNHLYLTPQNDLCRAVVAFNGEKGTITLSLADPVEGVSCREIVQSLWGMEAGGRDGIAGSPRGRVMLEQDAKVAINAMWLSLACADAGGRFVIQRPPCDCLESGPGCPRHPDVK